jgi:hypothetical protein
MCASRCPASLYPCLAAQPSANGPGMSRPRRRVAHRPYACLLRYPELLGPNPICSALRADRLALFMLAALPSVTGHGTFRSALRLALPRLRLHCCVALCVAPLPRLSLHRCAVIDRQAFLHLYICRSRPRAFFCILHPAGCAALGRRLCVAAPISPPPPPHSRLSATGRQRGAPSGDRVGLAGGSLTVTHRASSEAPHQWVCRCVFRGADRPIHLPPRGTRSTSV